MRNGNSPVEHFYFLQHLLINSLPNNYFICDQSKLKACTDNKINVICFGKRRKWWLPAFSSSHNVFRRVLSGGH